MNGEPVVVERPTQTGTNAHNQPIYMWVPETVEDVLVAPGPRADIDDTARPEGVVVAWSLHWPRTYTKPLAGCRVIVRGQPACPIVGDPQVYMDENTPTRWNRPSEAARADG